jgi:urease accessory protein
LIPFVTTAWNEPERLAELDELCDVFTTNHVANRASRLQGKAFATAVLRIFGESATSDRQSPACGHFAPVFGAGLRRLGVSRRTTIQMFVFGHLRSTVAAAVRLNIIGPMEAQILQHRICPKAEELLTRSESLSLDDLAQSAPLIDLWQAAQDRLYSRLFQS